MTRAAVKTLRARFPGARQRVYERRQSLPIDFAPAERGSAVFSLISAEGFTKVGRHFATTRYRSGADWPARTSATSPHEVIPDPPRSSSSNPSADAQANSPEVCLNGLAAAGTPGSRVEIRGGAFVAFNIGVALAVLASRP